MTVRGSPASRTGSNQRVHFVFVAGSEDREDTVPEGHVCPGMGARQGRHGSGLAKLACVHCGQQV